MNLKSPAWISRGVVGIVLATFFSDVGHEMVTATLPLYISSLGLGAASLGVMEGFADLLFSLSKLGGGWIGHRTNKKRAWGTFGYLLTSVGTGLIALVHSFSMLTFVRGFAWLGRGFRSPLRDFMLADEVGSTHFARAYGIERAADMLGAVAGPLIAALLIWIGIEHRSVILISLIPSMIAVLSFYLMTKDREASPIPTQASFERPQLPKKFWRFVSGVALFGLGDFSRTFLIFLAAKAFGESSSSTAKGISVAVLLYAVHNLVSALAAYPAGYLGDRFSKLKVLSFGYALGVLTNILLACSFNSPKLLILAIVLSGIYIAIEETLEKAVAAEILPREQRSFGLGVLASGNAIGDMISSIGVGVLLAKGYHVAAFMIPAVFGALGTLWMFTYKNDGNLGANHLRN